MGLSQAEASEKRTEIIYTARRLFASNTVVSPSVILTGSVKFSVCRLVAGKCFEQIGNDDYHGAVVFTFINLGCQTLI